MSKKRGNELRTGLDFIEKAKESGAVVTPNSHGRFTSIETPAGKVYVNPSPDVLDKQTRGNLKRWFRLLGILIFIFLCAYPIYIYISWKLMV